MTTTSWSVTRLLRDRNATLYLTGVVVSGFGSSALWLVSGVWVKDLTGSNGLAALCTATLWAPTLAGPVLGTLADRVRRKPLLICTNLALAVLLLPLWTVGSPGSVPLLLTVLFLYGAAGVVEDAASSALVAAAVDPALLGDFNGLRMTAREGMKLVAPLTGAALYTAYGGPSVALLDALTFVLAAGLCALLRVREERPGPAVGNWRRQTAEGARLLWAHPAVRPLVRAGGATLCLASLGSSLNYAVVAALGRSPAYVGVMYAVQGVGSVAVGLVSGPALRRLGERRFATYGIALTGVAVAGRAVPCDIALLACSLAGGLGLPCVLIAAYTAVQREIPAAALGRATATADTLMFTPNVIGLAVGAALVELVDLRPLLAVLGGALLATAGSLVQRNASRTSARSPSDANPA
ncbi:MFS transporter [Streptomyces sp. Ag109_O5-1]|uniref:MFS transporter n=1 Tax=Streptomyces sp. Ag109_O5-1 TaxID=1938851 RepID=UPI000F4F5192|nr:MFS transporter [Streptomyces sp. Ag109_O5-1]RPE44889.1 MFS transporter [Streptomyces sp. Ag109_O5-1]